MQNSALNIPQQPKSPEARPRSVLVAELHEMARKPSKESNDWFWKLPKEERMELIKELAEALPIGQRR